MTGLIAPILLGALAAAAGLAFVLLPMLRGSGPLMMRAASGGRASVATDDSTRAIDALREIEFDRETGKLSDADYATLKATYTASALSELRGDVAAASADRGSSARGRPRPASVCPTCGPRPEADAIFCSQCARYLPGSCESCGAAVAEFAARYCAECGHRLAA